MTKLEWCKENAPDSIQELSDSEILCYMSDAYERFCANESLDVPIDSTELNSINSDMDFMVTVLTRAFGDKLAFKGGYMLTKLLPKYARQTTDIDFSIQKSELYKDLITVMHKIGDAFIDRGVIASYIVKPEVQQRKSGGMDMYDEHGSKILGIDIGWHDISFGTTTTCIDIEDVRAFTVERMLADKITAILSRKRFRRPKDIYDLYCITNCFDFDANVVNEFILKRTEGVGADWQNFPFNEKVITEYEKAYNKLQLNSIYTETRLNKPDFELVLKRFDCICNTLKHSNLLQTFWDHTKGTFV